jgi:hypothetical protein
MAGKTINKARMADMLASDLFGEFLWEKVGPANQNWDCVDAAHKKATHPSDVVFYYDEPYSVTRRYITADLKSYALGSITPFTVNTAAMKLATSLACAENSESFQKKYFHPSITAKVSGMLFVYNHDGQAADHDFPPRLAIDYDALAIPPGSKLAVFGPTDIFWLNNVARDIVQMRGKSHLPSKDRCDFYYPNLVRHPNLQPSKARAATLEMLTSPWIVLEYQPKQGPVNRGYVFYCRSKGEKPQEFVFLLDYLERFQLLKTNSEVTVKLIDQDPHAKANWGKAIDEYIDAQEGGDDLKSLLGRIKYEEVANLQIRFSEISIGMEDA